MANYNFRKDLALSQASVHKVSAYLQSIGATHIEENHDNLYDLRFTLDGKDYTVEVKEDMMYHSTGNVAIEYESRNKASGVATSQATLWCYVLDKDVTHKGLYFVTLNKLKRCLGESTFRQVSGGDHQTSKLLLLPVASFLDIFEKRA